MGSENHRHLHVSFFPFMAHGHMIPTVAMAKLFNSRGVKTSIITTPHNASVLYSKIIERTKNPGNEIDIKTIKFPDGFEFEKMEPTTNETTDKETWNKFLKATGLLQEPLEKLLEELKPKPDCLVADMFFPWATDVANKFGIPRLVFHGTSCFWLCASECLRLYEPHKKVESNDEPFLIPNLPGQDIKLTKNKLPEHMRHQNETEIDMTKMFHALKESEVKSFGVIVNSFYELEAVYADFYRGFLGRKAWHIGPVSLCDRGTEEKAERQKKTESCLDWLDSKEPESVIYICFGSMASFTSAQLEEIATGLEASGQDFIWVVKTNEQEEFDFEERLKKGKGMVIRGWAPQVAILEHKAVGAFVTHCGWNSTLESVSAGVPMVTWPIAAEQFFNEKLVTDVLKIGIPVGVKRWELFVGDFVKKDAIEKVLREIMVGEKKEEMRSRAKAFGEMAKRAVQKDGSSYSDLSALIRELSLQRKR